MLSIGGSGMPHLVNELCGLLAGCAGSLEGGKHLKLDLQKQQQQQQQQRAVGSGASAAVAVLLSGKRGSRPHSRNRGERPMLDTAWWLQV